METIRKKISLETSKNRYINVSDIDTNSARVYQNKLFYYSDNSYFEDDNPWGGQCVDLLMAKYDDTTAQSLFRWVSFLYDNRDVCSAMLPVEVVTSNGERLTMKKSNDGGITNCFYAKNENTQLYTETKYKGKIYFLVRYKNLLAYYHWIKNTFIPSCTFYKVCKNRYKKLDGDKFFNLATEDTSTPFLIDYSITVYSELPNIDEMDNMLLKTICVTTLKEEVVKRFYNLETMGEFVVFMNYLFNHGLHKELNDNNEQTNKLYTDDIKHLSPYLSIPLSLSKTTVDIGMYNPLVETWVPNKKYYLGDIVYYNGDTYILNRCTEYELSDVGGKFSDVFERGETYKTKKSSVWTKDDYRKHYIITENRQTIDILARLGFHYYEYSNGNGASVKYNVYIYKKNVPLSYSIVLPYHCGVYDKTTMTTSFVEQTNENNGYWKKINCDGFYIERTAKTYNAICESKLSSVKRNTMSIDDDGNKLPFIVHKENGTIVVGESELEFKCDVYNKSENEDGTVSYDVLNIIRFYDNVDSEKPIKSFVTDDVILYSQIPIGASVIEFDYTLGCKDNTITGGVITDGVNYKEKYHFTHDIISGIGIDGMSNLSFNFANIDLANSIITLEDNTEVDLVNSNPIYSNTSVSWFDINNNTTSFAETYKDESLLGVQNVCNSVNVKITRGTSAALERHNILGEIKTLQDMENYRNNFFEI